VQSAGWRRADGASWLDRYLVTPLMITRPTRLIISWSGVYSHPSLLGVNTAMSVTESSPEPISTPT
jgi:hypothetical protein